MELLMGSDWNNEFDGGIKKNYYQSKILRQTVDFCDPNFEKCASATVTVPTYNTTTTTNSNATCDPIFDTNCNNGYLPVCDPRYMYCGANSINVTDINGTYVNNTVNNTINKITNGTDFKNTT